MISIAYSYHPLDHYWTGYRQVQKGPGIGLPSNTTEVIPPLCSEGMIQVFNEIKEVWEIKKDTFPHTIINDYELIYLNQTSLCQQP